MMLQRNKTISKSDRCPISKELYNKLNALGILDSEVRGSNVGTSDYSQHIIQPWSIWKDYNLNPWDADIVKRILRTKKEPGKSKEDARIMDYEKIIHICKERIRQLEEDKKSCGEEFRKLSQSSNTIEIPKPTMAFSLDEEEIKKYKDFSEKHHNLHKGCSISIAFTPTGIGVGKTIQCSICGKTENITNYDNW